MARLGAIGGGMAILVAMLLIAGCGKPQTSKSEQQPAPAPPPAVETPAAPVAEAPAPPPAVETPEAPVAEAPAPPPAVETPVAPLDTPAPANPLRTPASKPVAPTVAAAPGTAVFPSAISPTYANEKPYKARRKTCSDQFKANKATNANGGLKWIQKGGGYWNECNKHLKE
jgi:hypothetical protein